MNKRSNKLRRVMDSEAKKKDASFWKQESVSC